MDALDRILDKLDSILDVYWMVDLIFWISLLTFGFRFLLNMIELLDDPYSLEDSLDNMLDGLGFWI